MMDLTGFRILKTCGSENIYMVAAHEERNELIVQYKKGLKKYRFGNITQAMVKHMETCDAGLGAYIRNEISKQPDKYPILETD